MSPGRCARRAAPTDFFGSRPENARRARPRGLERRGTTVAEQCGAHEPPLAELAGKLARVALLALPVLLVSAPAAAVKLRRPFTSATARNYGFDNNGGAGGCTDYACKGACYDTHSGTDFPIKLGLVLLDLVLAAADGKVVAVVNACGDFGWAGNSCGGYCGNYVKIRHPDGSRTPIRPTPTVTAWATSASRPTR